MPPCPDGSRIKESIPEPLHWVLPDAACAAASAIPGWGPWIAGICSLLGPRLFNMADLCDSPPPEYPEINPVLLSEQGLLHTWQVNMANWVWAAWVNANWSTFCECNPTGGPGPCPPIAPRTDAFANRSRNMGYYHYADVPCPSGWDSFTYTHRVLPGATLTDYRLAYTVMKADNTPVDGASQTFVQVLPSGSMPTYAGAVLSATARSQAHHFKLELRPQGTQGTTFDTLCSGSVEFSATFAGTCGGAIVIPPPPDPSPPPPPPDAPEPPPLPTGCTIDTLCSMLYSVLEELKRTGTLVTIMQRYALPFATNPGTARSGLTGAGSFEVSGLIGIQVDVTGGLPPRQLEGVPPYVWDIGWMSIMTPDGMIEERRITRDTQIWQPRMIQEATTVGYFLKAGVTATITELWPEPY